jgi:hypothetical protein
VVDLSDERKRQIRAEEEAKLRAEEDAEQRYREEVRKELEGQQQAEREQQFRAEVRAELAGKPAPSPVAPAAAKTTAAARTRRPRSLLRGAMASVLVLGGLVGVGLAFGRGFTLPFMGPPPEITLQADSSGELEIVDEAPSGESGSPGTAPGGHAAAGGGTGTAIAPPAGARRATLPGTAISIEVPPGWFVEESELADTLEIRWRGSGVASGHEEVVAYLLIQRADLGPSEDLEEWAERMVEQVIDAASPEERIEFDREEVIASFHGVPALSIDIITRGFLPYHMRNYYWALGGDGYILTCYATAGSFEERAPTFERMIDSIRF